MIHNAPKLWGCVEVKIAFRYAKDMQTCKKHERYHLGGNAKAKCSPAVRGAETLEKVRARGEGGGGRGKGHGARAKSMTAPRITQRCTVTMVTYGNLL